MPSTVTIETWSGIPEESVLPGITRQIVHGESQTIVRYVYQPGAIFPIHHHPQEQATIVISGRIEFEVDGVKAILRPGQIAIIPANIPHGAVVVGNEVVETYNALSPRRQTSPLASPSPE